MTHDDAPKTEHDPVTHEVSKKARAYARARRQREGVWRHVALVSALGWTFILPVLLAAFAARWVARESGRPVLGLGVLCLGVGVGIYASYRQVYKSFDDEEEEES